MTSQDSYPFFDLAVIVCLAAVSAGVSLVPVGDPKLRFLVGAPLLVFLPGYALVSALFPARGPTDADSGLPEDTSHGLFETNRTNRGFGMSGFERLALGIGVSILLTPAFAAVLMFADLFDSYVLVGALTAVTIIGAAVGVVRRYRLPANERYDAGVGSALGSLRTLFHPAAGADRIVTVVLIASVLLFTATVAYAAVTPQTGESYTSFYVLSQNQDGDFVAADYPTNLSSGQNATFRVGVANHRHEETQYTLVVERQQMQQSDGDYTVAQSTEVTRRQFTLASNQTWTNEVTVQPGTQSGDVRVRYYLYRGDAPNDPSAAGAYRTLRTWISLGGGAEQTEAEGAVQTETSEAEPAETSRTETEASGAEQTETEAEANGAEQTETEAEGAGQAETSRTETEEAVQTETSEIEPAETSRTETETSGTEQAEATP